MDKQIAGSKLPIKFQPEYFKIIWKIPFIPQMFRKNRLTDIRFAEGSGHTFRWKSWSECPDLRADGRLLLWALVTHKLASGYKQRFSENNSVLRFTVHDDSSSGLNNLQK